MHFRIRGLPAEQFAPLFSLSDEELAATGAVRRIADDRNPGYPCRVSLTDSNPGDELILVNYEHHAVDSPYRMRFSSTCARATRPSTRSTRSPTSFARACLQCAPSIPAP
jgi:hypothetical protein